MTRRKARGPATNKVNGPRVDFPAAEPEIREAKPDPIVCLSVYDGARCVGFLMPRGKAGVEAFDA